MIDEIINGRYQINALLGKGGMGSVYQADDLVENRVVALKFLDLYSREQTDTALTRFQREFRVLTRLDHPHIVQAHEYGTHANTPYLVLEYLSGNTLTAEIITAPFTRARALKIASQICKPLIYLHSQSIVHRDLKPDNLMLVANEHDTAGSEIKLMDFGLVHQADFSMQITQEGMVLGTVAYMAPEQAQGFAVDFRADLYALGAILYQMVTGRPPFVSDNLAMMLLNLLSTPPTPPSHLNPEVDPQLEELIMSLLEKEPSARPYNTQEVAVHLATLADETVAIATAPTEIIHLPGRIDLIPRIPLIGRQGELNQLLQAWKATQSDQGKVILLSGLAGTGKTRILEDARPQIKLARGLVVRSQCQDQAGLPYQPIINVLEALLSRLPTAVSENLPTELIRLLPNSHDHGSFPDTSNDDQAEARRRLFTACWDVIKQSAEQQALNIVIEDLQWADPATLQLLDYLIDQVSQAAVLLVLTYRSEEFTPAKSLATLRRDVGHQQVAQKIELNRLTRDQVAHFLHSALGWDNLPDWLIDNFYQTTDGNPLFIEETLKTLAAEGTLNEWKELLSGERRGQQSTIANLQLPQNILDLAQRRLQPLSDEDRSVLTAASILGPEFPFVLLEEITKLSEDDLLDAIERLLAAGLIAELPLEDGEDRYRFTQEALRQALLNGISQRRARVLHRKAGEAIEAIYDTAERRTWPILAHHFALARKDDLALKYFVLAGNAAAQVYANMEAIGHYGRALAIAKEAKQDQAQNELSQLCTRLGRVLELDSQYDQALAHYEEIGELAKTREDRPLELSALLAKITLYATFTPLHDTAKAATLAEEALTLARELKNKTAEVKILWNMISIYGLNSDMQKGIKIGEQALALARELDLREMLAYILMDVGRGCMLSGRVEQATKYLAEAATLWKEFDNLPFLTDSLNATILLNLFLGNYDQAIATSDESYQLNKEIDNPWGQSHSRYSVGRIYWDRGQVAQAIEVMTESIELAERAGFGVPQVMTWGDLAAVYADMGAFDHAKELIYPAIKGADTRMPSGKVYVLGLLAQIHLWEGDLDSAQAVINKNKENESKISLLIFNIPIILAEVELALRQQDTAQALALADDLISSLESSNMAVYLPHVQLLRGKALIATGNEKEGYAQLQKGLQLAQKIGSRRAEWQILAALARLERDHKNANRYKAQAHDIVQMIATQAPSSLRDAFLALAKVRETAV